MVNGSNVEKGGIYKIDVFKSKDKEDNKLYFAFYDMFEIKKINSINKNNIIGNNFNIQLWYGRGKNNKIISYIDAINEYELYTTLNKNDLVRVINKDSRECIAYVVGGTSGKLEVKSKLGDGYDIIVNNINENNIFDKENKRYTITVSTIKEIKKLSINILGEISGL